MKGFLLDTNIPSELSRPRPEPRVLAWLQAVNESKVYIRVITLGEIRKGCALRELGKERTRLEHWLATEVCDWFEDRILSVGDAIAERWGELEAARQRRGRPLNTADGLIAATALVHDLHIVTHNVSDFEGIGASVIDPWK